MADTVDVILLRSDAVAIRAWIIQITTSKYKAEKAALMAGLDAALAVPPSGESDPFPVVFQPNKRT